MLWSWLSCCINNCSCICYCCCRRCFRSSSCCRCSRINSWCCYCRRGLVWSSWLLVTAVGNPYSRATTAVRGLRKFGASTTTIQSQRLQQEPRRLNGAAASLRPMWFPSVWYLLGCQTRMISQRYVSYSSYSRFSIKRHSACQRDQSGEMCYAPLPRNASSTAKAPCNSRI